MLLKILVIAILLIIIYCLGSGLFFLMREGRDSTNMVKALTWRIVLSFILFIFLILTYLFGWITPHGVS